MATAKKSASKVRRKESPIAEKAAGAPRKPAPKKKVPLWPKDSERSEIDPKTGLTKMSAAVEARRALLVDQGYERLNGMLPPEACEAWRELKEAGVVENRLQALSEGVVLLRDTRLGPKARKVR